MPATHRKGNAAIARTRPDPKGKCRCSSCLFPGRGILAHGAQSCRVSGGKGKLPGPGIHPGRAGEAGGRAWSQPHAGHGCSACSLRVLKCCPLVLCTIPCFQGSVPDSGLESRPAEGRHAVVMAFRSFISPSRWAISLVSSSGS